MYLWSRRLVRLIWQAFWCCRCEGLAYRAGHTGRWRGDWPDGASPSGLARGEGIWRGGTLYARFKTIESINHRISVVRAHPVDTHAYSMETLELLVQEGFQVTIYNIHFMQRSNVMPCHRYILVSYCFALTFVRYIENSLQSIKCFMLITFMFET